MFFSAVFATASQAEVWADVRDNVITNNGVYDCTECHSYLKTIVGASSDPLSRHAAPVGDDFDGATDIAAYNNATAAATYGSVADATYGFVDGFMDRLYEWAVSYVSSDLMPNDPTADTLPGPADGIIDDYVFASPLSAAKKTMLLNWALQGGPYAAPTAVTDNNPTLITKTSATVQGDFNANVHAGTAVPGTYYFEYGTTTAYGSTTSATSLSSTTASLNQTKSITGLSCGTLYHYRARTTNGSATGVSAAAGVDRTFTTSACTNPVITEGASISPAATNEDTATTFTLNRTDDDPGTLTWSVQTQGSKGTFSFDTSTTASPVTVRYTPTSNLNGADTAGVIKVTNGTTGLTDTIAVNMSITAINDQPVIASTASTSAVEDTLYSYQVVVTDPDDSFGAGLTISLGGAPTGMAVGASTGLITWTPGNGVTTSGLVTVYVDDGGENGTVQVTQSFTVAVTGTNDPPVITPGATTTATEDIQYSYQVQVTDVDDVNNGTDITFTLSNQPTGMVVSTTGLITWTPLESVTTSGLVTISVEDGNEDVSPPDTENFTIVVTPVNDSPVVTPGAPTTANEADNYSYQIVVNDVDDANNGTDLTFTLTNFPTGMTVSSTGLIEWTVPRTNIFNNAFNNITVTVSDGGEDAATTSAEVFTLTVNPIDVDATGGADGVADYDDNCPTIANGAAQDNQADNDNDTVRILPQLDASGIPVAGDVDVAANGPTTATGGDACDTDDDNDGMPDTFEGTYGFDPFNPADAVLDFDGDGVSNLNEFLAGTDPAIDSVGPLVIAPADVIVDATGFLTRVNTGTANANDGNDGVITSLVAGVDVNPATNLDACDELSSYSSTVDALRPGAHTVTWATCDKAGNFSSAVQNVSVVPLLNTTASQTTGEGRSINVDVMLNGPAAAYPVTVDYAVTGRATVVDDYDPLGTTISITDPDIDGNTPGIVGRLAIDIVADAIYEDPEELILTFSNPVNAALGVTTKHTVLISDDNAPPLVELGVTQGGKAAGANVYVGGGAVSIITTVDDPNGDAVTYDWSLSDGVLTAAVPVTNSSLDFAAPAAGLYPVEVNVSDGASTTITTMLLHVVAPPDPADCNLDSVADANADCDGDGATNVTEDVIDSDGDGIADYLDSSTYPLNILQNQSGNAASSYLLETEPGLVIKLGTTALASGVAGALVDQDGITAYGGQNAAAGLLPDDTYINVGGYYDFEISGLVPVYSNVTTASVVIPLQSSIIADAVYRKYDGNGWSTFVEDFYDSVKSAPGEPGVCPAPGSSEYTAGLTPFHYCVQLTIRDGGPNDADGVRDNVVRDPGGVAIPPDAAAVASSKGRIGVMHPLVLLVMLGIVVLLYRSHLYLAWYRRFTAVLVKKQTEK